ncbi:MAG: CBS domain-containing protein [Spirochaetales bacterium]|jgi:CBS domain-containing protein/anti-sigma regulatory factor (Ser/Thr protein kinase)|nr:CBS domain-containing protein [Spirochaetales bacterium]
MKKETPVNKIQELVYELNAGSVMTTDVTTVAPELPMSEVREVLRVKKISGMPVVANGKVVGVISIEDFIKWLADNSEECQVKDKMSKNIVSVYSDEPLVHVVNKLEVKGYGRLPVIDRKTGKLAGIITKGDIIEKLLHKIEVDYQEEEIRHYRASHFFEDIIADSTKLNFLYEIQGKSIGEGGVVASSLKKTLKRLGIHPELVRRTTIALYEAEMNVIIYAKEGRVAVAIDPDMINVEIEDSGQGIPDVEQALQAGYSTAPEWVRELGFGAGMGLQNIKKNAGEMAISSVVGEGTLLKLSFAMERE